MDTEECVKRCKQKHGDLYDYSQVVYVNQKTPIKIMCKEHGEFLQRPTNHYWAGNGCPTCGKIESSKKRTLPYEKFIINARNIHGNLYSYDEASYSKNNSLMRIQCKKHGWFEQTPNAHVGQKQGCPKCVGKNRTQEEVIQEFKKVHQSKYDYSHVVYINARTKIEIICKEHGSFFQTPSMHKWGQGCPKCGYTNHHGKYSDSYFNNRKPTKGHIYVWELYNKDEVFIKVGITKTSVKKRINNNKTRKYKTKIVFECSMSLQEAYRIEQLVLHRYKKYQYVPSETFQGRTECLLITQKQRIIDTIKEEIFYAQHH